MHPVTDVLLRDGIVPADRAVVERILLGSNFFRSDELPVALELVDEFLAKGAKSDYRFVVAERNGSVVGYCCYGMIPCTLHSYDLYWIAVDPTRQRGGIGKRLMAAADERIRALGGRRLYIETSSKPIYEPTHKFYLAVGCKLDATLEDFYGPGDSKMIFVKVL